MSSINRLEDYEEYYIQGMQNEQRVQKSSTETLPTEVLSKIFSYLGNDLQQVTPVNGLLCRVAIGTAKHQNLSAIQSFVNFICNYLGDSHADQKKQLLNNVNRTTILDSVNLIQVKSSMDGMKESILNVLKNLAVTTLDELEALSKNETIPLFFEDVFFLARIYKQIDEANAMADIQKPEALDEIVDNLLENGNPGEVTKVANIILSLAGKTMTPGHISLALEKIANNLLEKDKIEEATKVAYTIPWNIDKREALEKIIDALLEKGETEEATRIAYTLSLQDFSLDKIVDALLKKGDIEEATKIAYTISDDWNHQAFEKIVDALLEKSKIEEAIKIAYTISDPFYGSCALLKVVTALLEKGKSEEATKIAYTIPDDRHKSWAFLKIANFFKDQREQQS